MVICNDRQPRIPQFYAGRTLLITGATGFMGKVLVERLLTTCPDIEKLILLMREKKNQVPEKRLEELTKSQVFDRIRSAKPELLKKLTLLRGDTASPNLGIDNDGIKQLHQVSVVFHVAATLKFDEELRAATALNVRSVISLLKICDTLPNMEAFMYVSTAYSNAELSVVEEKVYKPKVELDKVLQLVDALPQDLLRQITPELISPKPNTYTFTKALAEMAVEQHGNRGYPVAIFRPTIVISSIAHPFPGWIENLNGPSGVVTGIGKGLLHVIALREDALTDLLPADVAIDTLIAAAWETAQDCPPSTVVYNCSAGARGTWGDFRKSVHRSLWATPFDAAWWYPWETTINNKFVAGVLEGLFQTFPLHLADYTVKSLGIKSKVNFIALSGKLSAMNKVLRFFTTHEWLFKNDNVRMLRERLCEADKKIYNLDPNSIQWNDMVDSLIVGSRRYLLKESDKDIEKARRHMKRLYLLHTFTQLALCALAAKLVLHTTAGRTLLHHARMLLQRAGRRLARHLPARS